MVEDLVVCVVDDDEDVLLSVKALLRESGHEAHCFASAAQFLDSDLVTRPGCVITDLRMPEIDGLELQRRLIALGSPLSIIVVSGVADVPSAVRFMASGAVTVLEKPYCNTDLLEAVERGLSSSEDSSRQARATREFLQRLESLSSDEHAVMNSMLADEPNKSVAQKLELGMRTIDRRRKSVLDKMGVSTVPELATLLATHAPKSIRLEGEL